MTQSTDGHISENESISLAYESISLETLERLDRYLRFGYYPGDAMGAVLENNLSRFANSADDSLWRELRPLCRYLYNRVPAAAWGSREAVSRWIHYTNDYRATALVDSGHDWYIASRRSERGGSDLTYGGSQ